MKRVVALSAVLILVAIVLWIVASPGFDDRYARQEQVAGVVVRPTLSIAIEVFRKDVGRYPTTDEGIRSLAVCPASLAAGWRGPYVETKTTTFPKDPWMRDYQYRSPGSRNPKRFDVWSLGPDGVESSDDIGNW